MRKFRAMPMTGIPGMFKPKTLGVALPAIQYLDGVIVEPGDPLVVGAKTLAEHKKAHWDESTGSLKVPVGASFFTIGPDVLGGLSDATPIALQWTFVPQQRS